MGEIYEIRLERLRRLMNERYDGKQAAIADAVGKPADYISRVLKGKKRLGEEMVREFEETLELPDYWFDDRIESGQWPLPGIDPHDYQLLSAADKEDVLTLAQAKVSRLTKSPSIAA